jgi:hypothetical protein
MANVRKAERTIDQTPRDGASFEYVVEPWFAILDIFNTGQNCGFPWDSFVTCLAFLCNGRFQNCPTKV